jgi:hypothetical protein
LSVLEFFTKYAPKNKEANIEKQIADILNVVNLKVKDFSKKISAFSG